MFQQVPWLKRISTSLRSAVDRVVREKEATVRRISLTFASIVDSSGSDSQDSSVDNVVPLSAEVSTSDVNILRHPSSETVRIFTDIYRDLFTDDGVINLDVVKEYLRRCPQGEDILSIEDSDHYNLLHKAVIFDSVPLVRLILDYGCDVNATATRCSSHGEVCRPLGYLHLACLLGRTDIVRLLLRIGADVSISKCVHISRVDNCLDCHQPELLALCHSQELTELLSTCGERPPAFFSILLDHVDVLAAIIGKGNVGDECEEDDDSDSRTGDGWEADETHSYLLHVACRVGAYRCLEYLVQFYPREVNMFDSDGLPPLLMVMKHGLSFVLLLLQSGADKQIVEHFWEEGTNILHLLYRSMPFPVDDQVSLRQVTELCIDIGASVNAERHITGRTPLHDIVCAVNHCNVENTAGNCVKLLNSADDDIIATITVLLERGAKMNIADGEDKTPLHLLLGNDGHTARFERVNAENTQADRKAAYASRKFGLENVAAVTKLLLEHAPTGLNLSGYSTTPLMDFIQNMCFAHHCSSTSFVWSLENFTGSPDGVHHGHDMLRGYYDITKILLEDGCCDPNKHAHNSLPALLCLLSYATGPATFAPDYFIISPMTATGLSLIMELLLQHGAQTEYEQTEYDVVTIDNGEHPITCFDFLVNVLTSIHASPDTHRPGAMQVLHTLTMPLVQYGAATVVSSASLYTYFSVAYRTFLYILLEYGQFHLQFVNHNLGYRNLFTVLCNHTDHHLLQTVLSNVLRQFTQEHPRTACPCGKSCGAFFELIDAKLSRPRSLKQISRHCILFTLQFQGPLAVTSLPLPKDLHEYLLSFVD